MRNYGTIATAIWADPDFRELTGAAQRLYLLLITQPNITSIGTLSVTLRRWAGMAHGSTIDDLSDALSELEATRYVVLDWEQEELLVRTFVRWDGGHTNPKRRTAILAAAKAVTSPIIASALAAELDALHVAHEIPKRLIDDQPIGNRTASDSASKGDQTPFDPPRSVVTYVSSSPNPQSTTRTPQSTLPAADASTEIVKAMRGRSVDAEFDEFWTAYPRKTGKDSARRAFASAIRGRRGTAEEIITGCRRFANDPNLPVADEKQWIPYPSTWLNAGSWNDEPLAPRVNTASRPSTTDARMTDALDLAAQLRAEEQAATRPARLELAR